MPARFRTLFLPFVLLAAAGLALSGCGRKGDLDVPGATHTEKPAQPGEKPEVEDRPFLLDPLL